ncbi:MAG TPA: bifunctional diaminohydroxyphosphoribosylaminopyrimidine deaminase/5-amino-6-(5-phosphoribosylamino)uracil reductase RibD [Candidatus Sulfotelmatobacter sp.]|jgi:diaminohydroxyphosphoribosylaminopyrimidine deaminase/5-amino-6-(5-phosphoribosylamino)uracil reductase|nr:bifunctional diaminohydroxyphosphoribosylaminopyrimidine deaminase/5-amino-6-(5-phosphoribosylamino)uracil reductase RibD [Candidatus Sulfotelmatobacter sp.]
MEVNKDVPFLKETLILAKKGMGWAFPNPMVGAVIVKNGKIIAKGYHKKAGLPHAEIEALHNAKKSVQGATIYVNLEPCSHFGKTPPCVDALIAAGIIKVVCCTKDPNPKVKGQGIQKLQQAGITVSVAHLEKEARRLNEAFFTFHEKKRPFIAIKFAASLDGKIATRTGDSKWITNEKARSFARKLRSEYQAILVGINTIIKDNPHLGVRILEDKDPLRIVLDSRLRIPLTSQVLRDTNVLIVTTKNADKEKIKQLQKKNITCLVFDANRILLRDLLEELRKRDIISVFVEGGSQILGDFVDEQLVDKAYAFFSPIVIGGKKALSAISGKGAQTVNEALFLEQVSYTQFENNLLIVGYPKVK